MKTAGSLSLEEAARRLGVPVEDVEEAILRGEFPGRFLEGGSFRVAESEVDAARARGFGRVLEPEVEEASFLEARGLSAVEAGLERAVEAGLERMQVVLTRAWEEDRALLREDVGAILDRQEVRLGRIEEALRRLRFEVQELWVADRAVESNAREGESSIREVAHELAELEAMVLDSED